VGHLKIANEGRKSAVREKEYTANQKTKNTLERGKEWVETVPST